MTEDDPIDVFTKTLLPELGVSVQAHDLLIFMVHVSETVGDATQVDPRSYRKGFETLDVQFCETARVVMGPGALFLGNRFRSPTLSVLGDHMTVVVSLDASGNPKSYPIQNLAGIGAVIDEISRTVDDIAITLSIPDGLQCLNVAVKVGYD